MFLKQDLTTMNRSPRPARSSSMLAVIAVIALVGGLVTSCNLPNDRSFKRYDTADLPQVITNTTTTTTTTTTLAPTTTTIAPEATAPPSAPSTPPSTSPPVPVIERILYLTVGFDEKMRRFPIVLPEPATVDDIIAELESPPPAAAEQNLRTALRPDLVRSVDVSGGLATVDLNGSVLSVLSENSKRRAIGQIVLTLTVFTSADRGNIGQVLFNLDGTPFGVLVPATGVNSPLGEPVTFEDFAPLIEPDPLVTNQPAPSGPEVSTPASPPESAPGATQPAIPSATTTPP